MNIVTDIAKVMREKTCIVGIGNYIRKDDAVGLYLADSLRESLGSGDVEIVNAEDIIESYVFEIAEKPCENVVVVDALSSQSEPGSVVFGRLLEFDEVLHDFSTHKLSLKLAGKIWEEKGKKVYLLGIEAADLDYGKGLTDTVKKSADMLKDIVVSTIISTRKEYVYEQ